MRTSKTNHRVRGAGGHGAERTWNMPFTMHSISHITSLVTSSLRDVRAGYFYLYKLLLAITKRYY